MKSIDLDRFILGYRTGIFPMAKSKTSKEIYWVKPKVRGIVPIGKLHISKSLKRFIKSNVIEATINQHFLTVVESCADRSETWINDELKFIYNMLYEQGHAVSIEIWLNSKLIGGLFGISIGSCFCGESMFSSANNGSKLALIVTMARLKYNNFKLFDTQFPNDHLKRMGGISISQNKYEVLLMNCLKDKCSLVEFPSTYSWSEIMQLNNQTL